MLGIEHFIKNAQGLTKNPLGIIALFISLIYGFACLVLSSSKDVIDAYQKWPLIWFLVLFPVLVLGAFVYLVVNHHKKLYGPGDFKDESNFFKAMDEIDQREKLSEEIKILQESEEVTSSEEFAHDSHELNGKKKGKEVPDINKISSGLPNVPSLRQSYMLAEDLALRQLEIELKTTIKRKTLYRNNPNTLMIGFDGIASVNNKMMLIEVKYIKGQALHDSMINSIKKVMERLVENKEMSYGYRLLIVIVHEGGDETKIKEQVSNVAFKYKLPVDVYTFNFNDLRIKFGIDQP